MYESCTQGECSPFVLLGLVSFIPGSFGNKIDDVIGLLPAPKIQKHHIFPQKFNPDFEKVGIDIDQYTIELSEVVHLKGVHGNGGFVGPGGNVIPRENGGLMRFFRLDPPDYESDSAYSRNNPIEWTQQYVVPGVICPECGAWGGRRRLFLAVEDMTLKKRLRLSPYPISLEEWKSLASRIIESVATASDYDPEPGDELGDPTAKITSNKVPDFIFLWRGGILITEKTRNIIIKSELTGCQFLKVELTDKRSKKSRENPLPSLYVLLVTGRINSPIKVDRCSICGRLRETYSVELSEASWDGNDFIIDENYPDLVFVTERACAVFKQNELNNYQCKPIKGEN